MRTISFAELDQELGDQFVLFVGSAISGTCPPNLPMVGPFISEILTLIATDEPACYRDALVSAYARSLVQGRYSAIKGSTKFEEFIWLLERATTRRDRDMLLLRAFGCGRAQYGWNHAAIAALLKSRRALACITTNFDNAIERSCMNLSVRVFPFLDGSPEQLPTKSDPPLLLKIHGDALRHNCVAVAPSLSEAARKVEHQYLRELLKGRRVLVVGYSGVGDIDIAPCLQETDATFFWVGRCGSRDRVPYWAHYRVLSDLSSETSHDTHGHDANVLVALAGEVTAPLVSKPWRQHLRKWYRATSVKKDTFIVSLLSWRTAQPRLHIHSSVPAIQGALYWNEGGWACIEAKAYWSALTHFRRGLDVAVQEAELTGIRHGIGFSLWRIGHLEAARRSLTELTRSETALASREGASVLRVYLEVCRDILSFKSHRKRRRLYSVWQLGTALEKARHLTSQGAQNEILMELVVLDIERLVSKVALTKQLEKLYADAMACQYYEAAQACAIALFGDQGIAAAPALMRSTRELLSNHHYNYVSKAVLTLVQYALFWYSPALRGLLARVLGLSKVPLMELRYKWWRRRWRALADAWRASKAIGV